MERDVELYGLKLNEVPVVGSALSSERFLRGSADALSIARIVGSPAIAGYILKTPPEERTWGVAAATAALGATDKLDGDLIGALKEGMSEEEIDEYNQTAAARFGKKVDHIADKTFVGLPLAALTVRREVSPLHISAKVWRDRRVGKIKDKILHESGEYPSAMPAARWKAAIEMGGVAVGVGPLSAYRAPDGNTSTEHVFRLATAASLYTGERYAEELRDIMKDARTPEEFTAAAYDLSNHATANQ